MVNASATLGGSSTSLCQVLPASVDSSTRRRGGNIVVSRISATTMLPCREMSTTNSVSGAPSTVFQAQPQSSEMLSVSEMPESTLPFGNTSSSGSPSSCLPAKATSQI